VQNLDYTPLGDTNFISAVVVLQVRAGVPHRFALTYIQLWLVH
jgi:hypothetical protein